MTRPNVKLGLRMIGESTLGDMRVPRLGFGAMRITGEGIWGEPRDPAEARRLLQRVVELGIRVIDTADAYGPEVSERLIAEALHPYPKGLVIATKGGVVRPDRASWPADGRPEHLREACEASLRRLHVDRIDLYQLHTVDRNVPLEDSVGALKRLQDAGKIRHIGLSNVTVQELERARRLVKVVSVQNRYNIADRTSQDVLDVCERDGLAFLPWSPLGQGDRDRVAPQRIALENWAKKRDFSVHQASLAWLLLKSPAMLPIPGTSQIKHLESNFAAALAARPLCRELAAMA